LEATQEKDWNTEPKFPLPIKWTVLMYKLLEMLLTDFDSEFLLVL